MPIPPEIKSLIDRLNLELETIEQEGIEGENLLRQLMSLFPNNASLIQHRNAFPCAFRRRGVVSLLCLLANYSIFCGKCQKTDRRN